MVLTASQTQWCHGSNGSQLCFKHQKFTINSAASGAVRCIGRHHVSWISATHGNTLPAALPRSGLLQSLLPPQPVLEAHEAIESSDSYCVQDAHPATDASARTGASTAAPEGRAQQQLHHHQHRVLPSLAAGTAGQSGVQGHTFWAGVCDRSIPGAMSLDTSSPPAQLDCSTSSSAAAVTAAMGINSVPVPTTTTTSTSLISDLLDAAALSSGDALGPGTPTSSFILTAQQPAVSAQAVGQGPLAQDSLVHDAHICDHPTADSAASRRISTPSVSGPQVLAASSQLSGPGQQAGSTSTSTWGSQDPGAPAPTEAFSSVDCDDEAPCAPPLPVQRDLALAPFFGPPYPFPTQAESQLQQQQQQEQAAARAVAVAAAAAVVKLAPAEALMAEAWTAAAAAMAALWGLQEEEHHPLSPSTTTEVHPTPAGNPTGSNLWQLLGQGAAGSTAGRQGSSVGSSFAAAVGQLGVAGTLNQQLRSLKTLKLRGFRFKRCGSVVAGSTALSAAAHRPGEPHVQKAGHEGGVAGALELPLGQLASVPGRVQELASALKLGWPPLSAMTQQHPSSSSSSSSSTTTTTTTSFLLPQLSPLWPTCGPLWPSLMIRPDGSSRASALTAGPSTLTSQSQPLPFDDHLPKEQQQQVQRASATGSQQGSLLPPSTLTVSDQGVQPQHHIPDASGTHTTSDSKQHTAPQATRFSLAIPDLFPDMSTWRGHPKPNAVPATHDDSNTSSACDSGCTPAAASLPPPPAPATGSLRPPLPGVLLLPPSEGSNGYAADIKGHLFESNQEAGSTAGQGSGSSPPKGAGWGSLVVATASAALAVGAAVLALAAAIVAAGMVLAFLASRVAPGLARATPVLQSLWRGLQACLRFGLEVWRLWQVTSRGSAAGAASSQ